MLRFALATQMIIKKIDRERGRVYDPVSDEVEVEILLDTFTNYSNVSQKRSTLWIVRPLSNRTVTNYHYAPLWRGETYLS